MTVFLKISLPFPFHWCNSNNNILEESPSIKNELFRLVVVVVIADIDSTLAQRSMVRVGPIARCVGDPMVSLDSRRVAVVRLNHPYYCTALSAYSRSNSGLL